MKSARAERSLKGKMVEFSHENELMPWDEVADEYNRRSGENLCRARVWQIAQSAQKKIRDAILAGSAQ